MTKSELVDLVDIHDRPVGVATIGRCVGGGLLHRAVAVLVIRSDRKYVLQQRSKRDTWHPGLWTISCTGHVKKGESCEHAAWRELREELGLNDMLRKFKRYLLPPISYKGMTECEWVTLFFCQTDAAVKIDPVELEAVREVSLKEIRAMLEGGSQLAPEARIMMSDFLASTRVTSHRPDLLIR